MTGSTARCDHIVALIDACLAEVEATRAAAPVTEMFQRESIRSAAPVIVPAA
ncbi:MAG TPA: hypothetical protein VGH66_19030 [Acidimicrobiales bacterium]|jgi:hypothetical protein